METSTGTALGSLFRFAGIACCRFDTESTDTPPFASTLCLFPQWKAMAEAGRLALPLAELEHATRKLVDTAVCAAAKKDYQRLFLSPELPVPLWESVWLSREKLLFTEETSRVRQWYSTYGLQIVQSGTEAEDHLGYELFFFGWLYDLACPNAATPNAFSTPKPTLDEVDAFMGEHLDRWGGACLEQLDEHATTPFWHNLFRVIRPLLG